LMPYLHLPVQSGSDVILAAMNRGHCADAYRRIVEQVRRARTDIALSSDFIVGFPGESDKDFEATLALVREVGFAQSYSFKYSRRPGTPAAAAAKQVAERVKDERLQALQALLAEQRVAFDAGCTGRVMQVLFEKPGRRAGQAIGRSPYLQSVHVEGAASLVGGIHRVRVDAVFPNSLKGSLVNVREKVLTH
jgi:tRNA-2-methylthio-N6-dimethylallyladenosine synthase